MDDQKKTLEQLAQEAAEIVHPIFVTQGWTWWDAPDGPTVEQIRDRFIELAHRVLLKEVTSSRTARLAVHADWVGDEPVGRPAALRFSLELGNVYEP